tara:strand:- start:341 stop:535 length:195 start_codon:yes stop_codon:yes gene_type:complete
MDEPKEIETVEWSDIEKSWKIKKVLVQEYHGFTECRYCHRPLSHNIKSDGEFKVVYVKCACTRT